MSNPILNTWPMAPLPVHRLQLTLQPGWGAVHSIKSGRRSARCEPRRLMCRGLAARKGTLPPRSTRGSTPAASRRTLLAPGADLEGDRHVQTVRALVRRRLALEDGSDPPLNVFGLARDRRSGDCEAAQPAAPERVGIRQPILRLVLPDRNAHEPRTVEQSMKFPTVGEPEERMPLRHVGRRCGTDLDDGVAEEPLNTLALRRVPPGERNGAARCEHTDTLRDRDLRPRKMPETEIAHHRVEGTVGKRQCLDVGLVEHDAGM